MEVEDRSVAVGAGASGDDRFAARSPPRRAFHAAAVSSGRARSARQHCQAFARYWILDPVVGAFTIAVFYLLRAMPIDWCSAIGGLIGVLIGRSFERAATRRARQNFVRLSPSPVGDEEADAVMTRLWSHVGRLFAETSIVDRLWEAGRIEVEGLHHLAAARDAGRPHLMMGLHLGTWEAFGAAMYALGFPGKFFYLPPRNRFQDRIARRARRGWGKVLPMSVAGLREAYRTLVEERGAVVSWVDEFVRGRGVMAPLFGRPVPTRSNLSNAVRLGLTSGAALLPFYVERLNGARFRLTILPEVELTRSGDREADVIDNVHRIDRLITPIITQRLEQWFLLLYLRLE
jgi:KDO2-lipid IV(A) lauroyltransferase